MVLGGAGGGVGVVVDGVACDGMGFEEVGFEGVGWEWWSWRSGWELGLALEWEGVRAESGLPGRRVSCDFGRERKVSLVFFKILVCDWRFSGVKKSC